MEFEDRFWSKVEKTDTCWLWQDAKNARGYGSIRKEGKKYLAHRLCYEMHHKAPIPNEMVLHHSCDHMHCINPAHLVLVPRSDPTSMSLEDTFWNRVEKTDTCWLWKGASGIAQSGGINKDGKTYSAHRLSYEMYHQMSIPQGAVIRHSCKILNCVRPDHLVLVEHLRLTNQEFEAGFWSQVEKTDTCWLWKGSRDKAGFGRISKDGHSYVPHRAAWEIYHKTFIPIKQRIYHTCGNIHCVKLEHLVLGIHPDGSLWDQVEKTDSCWLWKGRSTNAGYGQMSKDGKEHLTHRLVWEEYYGPIPPGLCICHHCDVPACVRPDHLFLGTHSDNMQDMVSKDRHYAITKPECVLRGEHNGRALLTEKEVLKIAQLREKGLTYRAIAELLDCSYYSVSSILGGTTWKGTVDIEGNRGRLKGEANKSSLVTESEVLEIVTLCNSGMSQVEIAEKIGVGKSCINHIISGRSWSWLTGIKPSKK